MFVKNLVGRHPGRVQFLVLWFRLRFVSPRRFMKIGTSVSVECWSFLSDNHLEFRCLSGDRWNALTFPWIMWFWGLWRQVKILRVMAELVISMAQNGVAITFTTLFGTFLSDCFITARFIDTCKHWRNKGFIWNGRLSGRLWMWNGMELTSRLWCITIIWTNTRKYRDS